MEKFIPYEKLSKKKKRELDAARRTVWVIDPVTRRPENSKAYNRKKAQNWRNDPDSVLSVFCTYKSALISESSGMLRSAPFFVETR